MECHEVISGTSSQNTSTTSRKQYLVHGDLTANNICVAGSAGQRSAYLFDWDVVRVQRGGPFDLAFAMLRLARTSSRLDPSISLSADEMSSAIEFWDYFKDACALTQDVNPREIIPTLQQLNAAFHSVALEYSLRMTEYFWLGLKHSAWIPDMAYVRRCRPLKALSLGQQLLRN